MESIPNDVATTSSTFKWQRLIGAGGYGEVHEVRISLKPSIPD
jgi:hypothetical protein